jgi:glycosyltransferase involved in cell wall biosynthesis
MLDNRPPLVSVGIPTFNRLIMLRRAVESVLAQDYPNLEVVISDNASTDGTPTWCEEIARRDRRVRFVRQPTNVGAFANFARVFELSRGGLYMVLGDDDWLDPSYVSRCSNVLLADPELATVCGTPRMYRDDEFLYQGRKMNLVQGTSTERLAAYFWQVGENVPFHGLMRRTVLMSLPAVPQVLAGDWLFVAWLAFLGKIRTLDDTTIHKSVRGTTGSWEKIASHTRLGSLATKIPYVLIMNAVFEDIAWASPVYASAGQLGRLWLASVATAVLLGKFALWSAGVIVKRVWYRFTEQPFPLRAG